MIKAATIISVRHADDPFLQPDACLPDFYTNAADYARKCESALAKEYGARAILRKCGQLKIVTNEPVRLNQK